MKLALIQMPVTTEKMQNLSVAARGVRAVAEMGCDMAVLPEMFCCPYDNSYFPQYAEEKGGMIWQSLSRMAEENKIWLVGGTMPERSDNRIFNSCFVFDRQGKQAAQFRKIHLFDIDIEGGQRFMESAVLSAGNQLTVFGTEFGKIGLAVCFDLRFPALFERTADLGAQLVVVPAAFNCTTGPKHWELLFRSRAVDNQLFTVGVSSARDEHAGYVAYGHSIVCDPWGDIVAELDEKAGILTVDIDLSLTERVRKQLPVRSTRKDFQG